MNKPKVWGANLFAKRNGRISAEALCDMLSQPVRKASVSGNRRIEKYHHRIIFLRIEENITAVSARPSVVPETSCLRFEEPGQPDLHCRKRVPTQFVGHLQRACERCGGRVIRCRSSRVFDHV